MAIITSRAYDCSLIDTDGTELEVVPCMNRGPTWQIVGNQLLVGALAWVIFVACSVPLERWWRRVRSHQPEGSPPPWARRFVGELYHAAEEPRLEQALEWGQLAASTVLVVTFILKTYDSTLPWLFGLEVACSTICGLHSVFAFARAGFTRSHAFSLLPLLDCFTLPATFLQHASKALGGGSWLTLNYLRTFHQLGSLRRLRKLGILEHINSDFTIEVAFAGFELLEVILTIAGTMWILEALGDITDFEDKFQASGMGEISFFAMVYFTFVTISTLGFGDYSPSTLESRFFIILAIFAGVTFFSYISVTMLGIIEMEASGRGRFRPQRGWDKDERGHILVMGGGVTKGSATVLETFLKVLCASRSALGNDSPEVVLLSQTPCSEPVSKLLKEPWAANLRIHYFIGSPLNKVDMNRVRASEASMIFVIADTETEDTLMEDQRNIMIAASVSRQFPAVQFRLMMVGLPALRLASQVGLSEFNCFSVEAFKAALMGTSLRCPGFSSLWINLALPDLPDTSVGYNSGLKKGEAVSPWLNEFTVGSGLELYGFLPSEHYIGQTFQQASIGIARDADLLLIAAHIDGAIVINPSSAVLDSTTVLFALAEEASACDTAAKNSDSRVSSWLKQFQANRKAGGFAARQRSKVVKRQSPSTMKQVHLASSLTAPKGDISSGAAGAHGGGHGDVNAAAAVPDSGAKMESGHLLMMPAMGGVFNRPGSSGRRSSGGAAAPQAAVQHSRFAVEEGELTSSELNATLIEDTQVTMKRCMATAEAGGHTIVVLTKDPDSYDQQTVWAQLEILVTTAALVPASAPSVVVVHDRSSLASRRAFLVGHPDGPKGSILASDLVSFLVGDPMEATVLQAAGADTCGKLVTLAPSAPPADHVGVEAVSEVALDEANLMLMMVIEQHLKVWGRKDLPVIFDMYVPRSAALCPKPLGANASSKTSEEKQQQQQRQKQKEINRVADARVFSVDPRAHPRFAAGHVLPKPCISAVYSMAYYTPGVLELLEALANPAKYDQTNAPLSFLVHDILPHTVGHPYPVLAAAVLESGAIPLGLMRAPSESAGADFPYVVTALPNQTSLVVGNHDCVYVLAHTENWLPSLLGQGPQGGVASSKTTTRPAPLDTTTSTPEGGDGSAEVAAAGGEPRSPLRLAARLGSPSTWTPNTVSLKPVAGENTRRASGLFSSSALSLASLSESDTGFSTISSRQVAPLSLPEKSL